MIREEETNQETYCKNCKLHTISHDKKQGILICRKCNMIFDFHYVSRENEVRNFEDDKENAVNPRVEPQSFHPLYGNEDFIANDGLEGGKFKKKSEQEKNLRKVEQDMQKRLRNVPKNIVNQCLRQFYSIALSKIKEQNRIRQENKNSTDIKPIPSYGLEAIKIDATIAMYQGMLEHAGNSNVLLNKLCNKMGITLDGFEKRIKDLKKNSIIQQKTKKAIDIALQIAKSMFMAEAEVEAVRQLAQNIEDKELQGGQQPQTVAGVIIYLICSNSMDKNLNTNTWQDISAYCDKAENTLKNFYNDKIKDIKEQLLPSWQGRAY